MRSWGILERLTGPVEAEKAPRQTQPLAASHAHNFSRGAFAGSGPSATPGAVAPRQPSGRAGHDASPPQASEPLPVAPMLREEARTNYPRHEGAAKKAMKKSSRPPPGEPEFRSSGGPPVLPPVTTL
jgi:hypothetical protein